MEISPENQRPEWRVSTVSYQYRVFDLLRRELLIWHWQPGQAFDGPDRPHLHVSAKLTVGMSTHDPEQTTDLGLDGLHLATGRVTMEAVVRTLIEDFNIQPQQQVRGRPWQEVLDHNEATFRNEATQHP
jgi:hypothetical protein